MIKTCIVIFSLIATPTFADDLLVRLEAASETIERNVARLLGADLRSGDWDANTRTARSCALVELEHQRGRAVAETYVRETERAAKRSSKLKTVGAFGSLSAKIHTKPDLRLKRDLAPIARKCGGGL